MKDKKDKQTKNLPLKKRGRPTINKKPLTLAERQARYREKQKQKIAELEAKIKELTEK